LLIEHARRRCRALDTKSLKAVFVTGEVCLPQDRQSITDFLRVPVANGYGSREAGFIAHECPQGNMHITAESVVVEISHDGEPAEAGESGEIVITHLDAYAMPFIRYRTGDVGRLKPGRCTCGRGSPMMEVVEGRTTDFLRLPNGTTKHALSIIYPLRAMSGIRRFRVLQHENYDVAVEVVADRASPAINATTVRESVLSIVGPDVKLTVDFVSHIETTPSGKHRFVESRAPVALPPPREEATAVD
jgi:phenylacetate-CoA ligase